MTPQCYLNFMVLNIFILHFFLYYANSVPAPTSGPFRSKILSVEDCANTSRPMMKNPPFVLQASITNETGNIHLLNNFTVLRNTKNMKVQVKSFIWVRGKWELNYIIKDMTCHGMLRHLICVATKVKYDRKTCTYFKGSYATNMDINMLQHLWATKMEYGRLMWRIEMTIPAGSVICKEYDTITEPIQSPNHLSNKSY